MVEIQGLKPWTSALPALRSNQLSYIPITIRIVNMDDYTRWTAFCHPYGQKVAKQVHIHGIRVYTWFT